MRNLLMVYHSQSGNTQSLMQAALAGATIPEIESVETRLIEAVHATALDLQWAHALILGTPENFGYMSGGLKLFLDEVFYPCETLMAGVPYATVVSAGNDGTGAVSAIDRILKGLSMTRVQPHLIAQGTVTEQHLQQAFELGQTLAAGLETGIY